MSFQFNKFEKVLVTIYVVIVVLMLINPPWAYFHPESGKFIRSLGEGSIFDSRPEAEAQIHFSILLYQIFVTGAIFVFIALVLRKLGKLWSNRNKAEVIETHDTQPCQNDKTDIVESPTILRRYLSTFIDGLLVLSVFIAVAFAISGESNATSYARVAVFILMFLFYEPILTSRFCTIGQKITRIRVRTAVTYNRISILAAYLRIFIKLLLGFISLFTIPITKDRRAIHDFASGSVVIMA